VAPLTSLLELQDLDLAGDRLRAERAALPERGALAALESRAPGIDADHAALARRRVGLAGAEHDLETEVAAMAARAKGVETTLYSGSVKVPKELSALQEEIRLFRVRQAEIEGRELALLEEIESTEGAMAGNRAAREALRVESEALAAALRKGEEAIDAELAGLATARAGKLVAIPPEVLAAYEKLRGRERLAGRVVARLADKGCSGCRMTLPVLDYNRMKAMPEDALLACTHCGRLLVR